MMEWGNTWGYLQVFYMDFSGQHLIALLLISREIDDLDEKSDSEIFTEESGKCRWHFGLLLIQILDQFKGQCKIR